MNMQSITLGAGLILLATMLPLPAQAAGTLLIIGDSLSDAYDMPREAGWAQLLADRLGPDYSVVNASISGETSLGGRNRLPGLIERHAPDWLLLILGGNDGLRALSPAQLADNLEHMIENAKQHGIDVALMQIRLPANLGPAYIGRFERVYSELAEQHGALLLPFFLENVFEQPGMMLADGIHPSEAAQALMLESIWPHVQDWLLIRP